MTWNCPRAKLFGDSRKAIEALSPLYGEVQEWELDNAFGQADDLPRPALTISGRLKGRKDLLTIHLCTNPPEDAEVTEKRPLHG